MQADILCVWRRIPSTKQDNSDLNPIFEISSSKVHPPLSLAAAKELWIFWYGEEPDLSELVDAELLKVAGKSKHYYFIIFFFLIFVQKSDDFQEKNIDILWWVLDFSKCLTYRLSLLHPAVLLLSYTVWYLNLRLY